MFGRVAERNLPDVDQVPLGDVAVDEHLRRGPLLFAKSLAELLNSERPAGVLLGVSERVDELEQAHRSGLGVADHLDERGVLGFAEDGGRDVDGLRRAERPEVAVVRRGELGPGIRRRRR